MLWCRWWTTWNADVSPRRLRRGKSPHADSTATRTIGTRLTAQTVDMHRLLEWKQWKQFESVFSRH